MTVKQSDASFYYNVTQSSVATFFLHKSVLWAMLKALNLWNQRFDVGFMPLLAIACYGTPIVCYGLFRLGLILAETEREYMIELKEEKQD